MGDVLLIATAGVLCASPAFQHNFQLFIILRCSFCWKFLVSLKSCDRHFLLVTPIFLTQWSVLNTPKSSGDPTANKSRELRPGDCAGQLTGPPSPSPCLLKVWFIWCLTLQRYWGGAPSCRTTGVVADVEAHVPKVLVNHSPNNGTLHLLVSQARQLVLRLDQLRCPPHTDGRSMLMSWCHSDARIIVHPDIGIVKVHSTDPCESCLISKQDVSYKLCVYNTICKKPVAKHNCQETCGLTLTGCGMG
jgi:hypothetical protein